MAEYIGALIGQAIGVLLWSFLNASVLVWRARAMRAWTIAYRTAYIVSIKAGYIAIIFANLAVLSLAFAGYKDEEALKWTGVLFGVVSWWFAHSNALMRIDGPKSLLGPKDARAISASVFGYLLAGFFGIGVLLIGILFLVAAAM
jgi:hypothetical protein